MQLKCCYQYLIDTWGRHKCTLMCLPWLILEWRGWRERRRRWRRIENSLKRNDYQHRWGLVFRVWIAHRQRSICIQNACAINVAAGTWDTHDCRRKKKIRVFYAYASAHIDTSRAGVVGGNGKRTIRVFRNAFCSRFVAVGTYNWNASDAMKNYKLRSNRFHSYFSIRGHSNVRLHLLFSSLRIRKKKYRV